MAAHLAALPDGVALGLDRRDLDLSCIEATREVPQPVRRHVRVQRRRVDPDLGDLAAVPVGLVVRRVQVQLKHRVRGDPLDPLGEDLLLPVVQPGVHPEREHVACQAAEWG